MTDITRRDFLEQGAAIGAGAVVAASRSGSVTTPAIRALSTGSSKCPGNI